MAGDVEPEILKSHDGHEEGGFAVSHQGHEGVPSLAHEGHADGHVLVVPGFLPEVMCRHVRAAMDAGAPEPAEILGDTIVRDEQVRRTLHIEIDEQVLQAVEARLEAVRRRLEGFFGLALGRREGTSVLRYTTGGFYRRHCDRGYVRGWPPASRRCIATVLFLSSSCAEEPDGAFSGGTLRLFPAHGTERAVPGRAGTLVAFPATMPHEVTTVTGGVRDTVVDWFGCRAGRRRRPMPSGRAAGL